MQLIYLLPFCIVSVVLVVVCAIVPRWRRYVFAAAIAPVAFAVCAITGLLLIALSADALNVDRALGIGSPFDTVPARGWITFAVAYGLAGVIGAYVAARVSNSLQRWYLAHRL